MELGKGCLGRGLSGETTPFLRCASPRNLSLPHPRPSQAPAAVWPAWQKPGAGPAGGTQRETDSFVGTWWPWVPVGALGDCPVLAAPGVCGEGEGTGDS